MPIKTAALRGRWGLTAASISPFADSSPAAPDEDQLSAALLAPFAKKSAAAAPVHASPPPSIIPALPASPGPPNWTSQVLVSDQDYVLAAGQYLNSNQTLPLIKGDSTYNHKLVNDGTLWIDGALDPNSNSAHIPFTLAIDVDVVNHGTAVAYGRIASNLPFADAIAFRDFFKLDNSGQIFAVTQAGFAYALRSDLSPSIVNSGLIAARADVGAATAIWLHNGGSLVNQSGGRILAEAVFAVAVSFGRGLTYYPDPSGTGTQITNAGLIQAASLDPSTPSVGLSISNLGTGLETFRVANSGTITADIAISDDSADAFSPIQLAVQIISNLAGGTINGAILLDRGDDVITNSGTIHGNVFLGEGADQFDTVAGSFQGVADLGWGADVFKGSAGADFVAGDDGDDVIDGNGGNDLLMGGANNDTLTGGAGNDGLFGEYGNDRIVTRDGDFVSGGPGDDRIELGDYTFEHVSGDAGFDTLVLPAGSRILDLSAVLAEEALDGIEKLVLGGGKELVVRPADIPLLADGVVLRIDGGATDTIDLIGAWTPGDPVTIDGVTYRQFQLSGETVLVSGPAVVAVRDTAPAGAVGLDPLAPGGAAPLPGEGSLDFTSNVFYLVGYQLSQPVTVNPEEIWWNDGGAPVLVGGAITNFGNLLSTADSGGLGTILQTLDLHGGSLANWGTVAAIMNGDDGQDHSNEEDRFALIYATLAGTIVNQGSIEAGTLNGVATAVWFADALDNHAEILAHSDHGFATGVDAPGLFHNVGTITAIGYSAVGVRFVTSDAANDGIIQAQRSDGGLDAVGVRFEQNFEGTFTNRGTITADIAFQLAGGNVSGLAPIHVVNQGLMDGRVALGSAADTVLNSGTITGAVTMGDGADHFDGSAGRQLAGVYGEGGDDVLTGGSAIDSLHGGDGADILQGGGGGDTLEGGAGADTFLYTAATDSEGYWLRSDGAKEKPDVIVDFKHGEDRIDLSQIDAIAGTGANDAFTFIGTGAFTHHAGELRFEVHNGVAQVYADVDGDGYADFQLAVIAPTLQASDFVL